MTANANLLGDGEALARRGYLDQALLEEIRAGQGHLDLANDLVALSALFADSWDGIRDRTVATEAEIDRAAELGPLILAALGVREHGPAPGPTDAADRRARAFTLFVRAYDQARRAVTYLSVLPASLWFSPARSPSWLPSVDHPSASPSSRLSPRTPAAPRSSSPLPPRRPAPPRPGQPPAAPPPRRRSGAQPAGPRAPRRRPAASPLPSPPAHTTPLTSQPVLV